MSKKSIVARNNKRLAICKKFSKKRDSLIDERNNKALPIKTRFLIQRKISDLPVDSSCVRLKNRCVLCGRARSVYRKFGLCRIHLRELALDGKIPGLIKSSW